MGSDQDFIAVNDLERAMIDAQAGLMTPTAFQDVFLSAPLYLPSASAIQSDWSGFLPVVYKREGAEIIAVFSEAERSRRVAHTAPYVLQIDAADFISRLMPDLGVVVNPGFSVCLELPPPAVRRMAGMVRNAVAREGRSPAS